LSIFSLTIKLSVNIFCPSGMNWSIMWMYYSFANMYVVIILFLKYFPDYNLISYLNQIIRRRIGWIIYHFCGHIYACGRWKCQKWQTSLPIVVCICCGSCMAWKCTVLN
jgi:hypothetical protein